MDKSNSYYITIPSYIYNNRTLSVNSMLLYGFISSVANKTGINHSSNAQITEELNLSEYQIRKSLKELEDSELITIQYYRNNFRRIYILDLIAVIERRQQAQIEKTKTVNKKHQVGKSDKLEWLDKYYEAFAEEV